MAAPKISPELDMKELFLIVPVTWSKPLVLKPPTENTSPEEETINPFLIEPETPR
tara:strand:- start:77 stop:241 length:165 start_codon:yes stop_codon:yes gene_type:complete